METITRDKFINIFRDKSISLFTWEDLFKIFNFNSNTAKALLGRLKKRGIIRPLTRGKYLFLLAKKLPEDFEIANFIYGPSYISLESALSFYGIIDQFPYQITSITFRKARNFEVNGKNFVYSHIKRSLFLDYRKENDYLIATPQKAVFDFFYLTYKGGKSKNNLKLLHPERNGLTKKSLRMYIEKLAKKDQKFISFCKNQKII